MHQQDTSSRKSVGCGIFGCLGGLVAGVVLGVLLLTGISLYSALNASIPEPAPTPPDGADLRAVIDEQFLNQYIADTAGETVNVDLLPNNQMRMTANATVTIFGASVPVQIIGLFELQNKGQTLEVALLDTEVSGVQLPQEFANFFGDDIAQVNQDLSNAIDDISNALGAPVIITHLTTTDSNLQIELREFPGGIN